MEFSYRYTNTMRDAFARPIDTSTDINNMYVTISKNNAFTESMVLDISDLTRIEVPTYIRKVFEKTIEKKVNNPVESFENKIVVPMYVNCAPINKRTSDSIISEFYLRTTFSKRLQKIVTNKGEIYYGNRGIILNKDLVPLIMQTLICKKIDDRHFRYTKMVLRIHPSVFLSNGLIEKSIIKKIIPFYITQRISHIFCSCSLFDYNFESEYPSIVIDDMSNFISAPTVPSIVNTEDSFNKCLEDNIDEILSNLW